MPAAPGVAETERFVLTVLYIEDDPSSVRLVERLLSRREDVRLHVAAAGAEGLVLAERVRPDLVLLDLHLPDLPGEVVLERLRALPGRASVAVVVLSADAQPETAARVRDLGVVGQLIKPLDVTEFYAQLDAVQAGLHQRGEAC